MRISVLAAIVGLTLLTAARSRNGVSRPTRDPSAEQQLMDVERRAYRETLAGNISAVLSAVSSDFVGWDSGVWNGKVQWVAQDKNAFANDLASGKGKLSDVTVDELEARVHGDIGVIRGRALFKEKDGRVFEMHFLDTWGNRDGRWVLMAGATSSQQNQ